MGSNNSTILITGLMSSDEVSKAHQKKKNKEKKSEEVYNTSI
jgi:hypothetical protein